MLRTFSILSLLSFAAHGSSSLSAFPVTQVRGTATPRAGTEPTTYHATVTGVSPLAPTKNQRLSHAAIQQRIVVLTSSDTTVATVPAVVSLNAGDQRYSSTMAAQASAEPLKFRC